MTTEETQYTIIDTPGYPELYDAVCTFVHDTPHPPCAAAAVLNAICAVALTVMSGDTLAKMLRSTADQIPLIEARAKKQPIESLRPMWPPRDPQ